MMESVSYKARECRDEEKIHRFLSQSRVGLVGIGGDEYPYVVPVNYVWHEGCIYFHGMGSGKKLRLLASHPSVSFTVYREAGTISDPVPCKADTSYMSVMVFGSAEKVTDIREAAEVLRQIINKFTPGVYKHSLSAKMVEGYRSAMDGNAVAVIRITPVHLTAKENDTAPDNALSSGHPGNSGMGHRPEGFEAAPEIHRPSHNGQPSVKEQPELPGHPGNAGQG